MGSPRPTRKLGVSLRERPASHADVVSAVHQLRSDMQTVVRQAVWSASSTPTQHPWGSNRSTHSGWAQKKAQRAMQHRAAAGNRPPKVIDLPIANATNLDVDALATCAASVARTRHVRSMVAKMAASAM